MKRACSLHTKTLKKKVPFKCRALLLSLIFAGSLLATISTQAQNKIITVRETNANLKEVLKKIEQQTGYSFMYVDNLVDLNKTVSVNLVDSDIEVVLKSIFSGLDINFNIVDKQIILFPQTDVEPDNDSGENTLDRTKPMIARGIVKSSTYETLPNATVYTKDKKRQTITDLNGYYELKVDDPAMPLIISFVGMEPQTIKPSGSVKETILYPNAIALQGVIITGYQTLKRVHNTGAAVTLQKENIEKRSMGGDMKSLLTGSVAGLQVGTDSQGGALYKIRGGGSLIANDPIFVLDGVEVKQSQLPKNLDEITNVSVLKDAASSALWGSRAGNGVIVVTTKRGAKGDLEISYANNFTIGLKNDLSKMRKLSAADMIAYEKEQFQKNYIIKDEASDRNLNGYSLTGTIFQDRLHGKIDSVEMNKRLDALAKNSNISELQGLQRIPFRQNHFLTFSGGTNDLSYYTQAAYGYSYGSGIGGNATNYDLNTRLNYNITSNLIARTDFSIGLNKNIAESDIPLYIQPYRKLTDAKGNYIYQYLEVNRRTSDSLQKIGHYHYGENELENARASNSQSKTLAIRTHLGLDWNIYKGLKWINDFQFDRSTTQGAHIVSSQSATQRLSVNQAITYAKKDPGAFDDGSGFPTPQGSDTVKKLVFNIPKGDWLKNRNAESSAWLAKTALNFDSHVGMDDIHYINAVVGFEVRRTLSQNTSSTKYGYDQQMLISKPIDKKTLISSKTLENWRNRPVQFTNDGEDSESYNENREVSSFASAVYTYDRRYNLSASFRMDESSMFGVSKQNRRNPIWSIGAGWNISNEWFMANAFNVNNLALRATYGVTGNFDRSGSTSPFLLGNKDYDDRAVDYVIRLSGRPNPFLKWERVRSFNLGLSAWLWSKLNIDVEYYHNYSYDLLGSAKLDPTNGFGGTTGVSMNAADMSNKGVEVTLGWDVLSLNDFLWNTSAVFSFNKNKILNNKVTENAPETDRVSTQGSLFLEGYPREAMFSYRWAGLDSLGRPQIYDSKNNKLNGPSLDAIEYSGTTLPVYTGSFTNDFSYKNFSLNVVFLYNFGHKFRIVYPFANANAESGIYNPLIAKRWRKPGDELNTDIAALRDANKVSGDNDNASYLALYSSNSVRDAGFVRLSEVNFIYNLPKKFLKKIRLKNMSLSTRANNLWLWTVNKEGIDPVNYTGVNDMPVPMSFAFGVKLDL